MLFNSYVFWAFFVIVFALYRALPHRGQNWLLLVASYVFYGWWDWRFLFVLAASTLLDYASALWIEKTAAQRRKKLFLILSVCVNLGFLGFFKYYGFLTRELAAALASVGISASLPVLNVILPVGISFYTFNSMSYVIDVYRGQARAERDLLTYSVYVCYFPHMVAGPIQRCKTLLPQIARPRVYKGGEFAEGLYHVVIGLLKKVAIADNLAPVANAVFLADPGGLSGAEVLVGTYAFAIQIYCDFSGYSSIAQGVSKWLAIDLTTNFRMPYFAVSPGDFWRRWHISLSTWLRDYLYISLGGNRGSKWQTYRNLMLTMFLGGLWHGANWTFVAWGTFHGLLLCLYRPFQRREADPASQPQPWPAWKRILAIAVTFHLVCAGWLLFRAESLSQAWTLATLVVTRFHLTPYAVFSLAMIAFYAVPLLAFEAWVERQKDMLSLVRARVWVRGFAYSYVAVMLLYFGPEVAHEFIYFQF